MSKTRSITLFQHSGWADLGGSNKCKTKKQTTLYKESGSGRGVEQFMNDHYYSSK